MIRGYQDLVATAINSNRAHGKLEVANLRWFAGPRGPAAQHTVSACGSNDTAIRGDSNGVDFLAGAHDGKGSVRRVIAADAAAGERDRDRAVIRRQRDG